MGDYSSGLAKVIDLIESMKWLTHIHKQPFTSQGSLHSTQVKVK